MTEPFLKAAGWAGAAEVPVAGDASGRRFSRLLRGGSSAILMSCDPARAEDIRRTIILTAWLLQQGFSAPRVLAAEPEAGLMLVEDFGTAKFSALIARDPGRRRDLIAAAVAMLAELAALPPPASPDLTRQDARHLTGQAMLLSPAYAALSPGQEAALRSLLTEAFTALAPAPPCLTLRDFHADNLFWLDKRRGRARIGLIDFQDALAGHPAYDLVSLLQDARAPLPGGMEEALLTARPAGPPDPDFRRAYATLGAQRHLRLLGNLTLLSQRIDPSYARLLPATWTFLQQNLRHPGLSALARWVAGNLQEPGRNR